MREMEKKRGKRSRGKRRRREGRRRAAMVGVEGETGQRTEIRRESSQFLIMVKVVTLNG